MKQRFFLIFGSLLLCLGFIANVPVVQASVKDSNRWTSQATNSYEPTLFFHGWGSSTHAEEHMAQALVNAGMTQTVVRANVSKKGEVTLIGHFQKGDSLPIVEVNFQDNRNSDPQKWGHWAKNVVIRLQKKYQIKKFNMVGHSMGNMAIVFYLRSNAQDQKLPKLQKQVDIAGHFNGILGMDDTANQMKLNDQGKPNKMQPTYKLLLRLRKVYPRKQIQVLNIYGDKQDGSHSDGSVSNASSQSLRYLVSKRAKSYEERKVEGANAQHSKLHHNKQVDQLLINFLKS